MKVLLLAAALLFSSAYADECDETAECNTGEICYEFEPALKEGVCSCPGGYTGDECKTIDESRYVDSTCPLPKTSKFPSLCTVIDGCAIDNSCDSDEICCSNENGCGSVCKKKDCSVEANKKSCTDQNKLCINDADDGFRCACASGYAGDDCKDRAMIDEMCEYPDIMETCEAIEPGCTATSQCDDGKICCSTGCGTECVDKSTDPPKKGLDFGLVFLLSMLGGNSGGGSGGLFSSGGKKCGHCPDYCSARSHICHGNLLAKCENICGQFCDFAFKDYHHEAKYVTKSCVCPADRPPANVRCDQEISYCMQYECGYLHCRVSRCGGCTVGWYDDNWTQQQCPQTRSRSFNRGHEGGQGGLFGNLFGK
ncbi:uncharacterized protein LOC120332146 [Styela clava]